MMLDIDANVSLVIYDLKGVVIKTLISEYQMSGPRSYHGMAPRTQEGYQRGSLSI